MGTKQRKLIDTKFSYTLIDGISGGQYFKFTDKLWIALTEDKIRDEGTNIFNTPVIWVK